MRAGMVKMVGKVNDTSKDGNAEPKHISEALRKCNVEDTRAKYRNNPYDSQEAKRQGDPSTR
jgi:hypothetical protein